MRILNYHTRTYQNLKSMARRKKTGELEMFRNIWDTMKPLERVSYVSGVTIREFSPVNWHHVLVKGKYPEFTLCEWNIVLLTFEEHRMVDNIPRSVLEAKDEWKDYWKLYDRLVEIANNKQL